MAAIARGAWLATWAGLMMGWGSVAGATASCSLLGAGFWERFQGAQAPRQWVADIAASELAAQALPHRRNEDSICLFGSHLTPSDWVRFGGPQCEYGSPGYYNGPPAYVHTTGAVLMDPVDVTPEGESSVRVYEQRFQWLSDVVAGDGAGAASGQAISPPVSFGTCTVSPSVIGFFNGVRTTQGEARDDLWELRFQFGEKRGITPLRYELFYNQTGCGTSRKGGCLEDLVETFQQRDRELGGLLNDRFETF